MLEYYKCKYYLNASHSFDNHRENAHSHTFTITFSIERPKGNDFFSFYEIDDLIQKKINRLDGTYLNEQPLFTGINPTLENIGDTLFDRVEEDLKHEDVVLAQVEICENPLRVYTVSNRILLPTEYANDTQKHWDVILEKQRKLLKIIGKGDEKE